ncbi:unnamed protein product [Brassicogethes aeneus]|uniref:Uncharacterized protein n=1 Tax=Brassicogethes aeneus TaxID=1431903 RepID=A0A9P0FHI4_BRAAE|nr:unnamed protein product [Brassicogethes aeneus]
MALSASLALSGLTRESLEGSNLEMLFDQADRILSASCSSIASNNSSNSYDSGISGEAHWLKFVNVLYEAGIKVNETLEESERKAKAEAVEDQVIKTPEPPKEIVQVQKEIIFINNFEQNPIMYDGRDILNLNANIRGTWNCKTAILPKGVESFFQNRSQLSRIDGVSAPRHFLIKCNDCDFLEPRYY